MPPVEPPPDAQQGPAGVRWQLLTAGQKVDVDETSMLGLRLHVFTESGKVVETGGPRSSISVDAARFPAELRRILGHVGKNGRARFWLSPEATRGWRPQTWPDERLRIDLTLLAVGITQRQEVSLPSPGRLSGIAQPTASAPPAGAQRSALQVPFQVLKTGSERKASEQDSVKLRFQVWRSSALATELALPAQASTRALRELPLVLRQILVGVSEGEVVRVWLKPEQARELLPTKPAGDVIVDIELEKVISA